MNKFLLGNALALALTSTSLSADPIHTRGETAPFGMANSEQIWLAKGDKGKGNGNGGGTKKLLKKGQGYADKGKGRPEHAEGPKPKHKGKGAKRASNGKGNGGKGRPIVSIEERQEAVSRILSTQAPSGRDMTRVLGATGLALATPQLLMSDVPEDELMTYSNCPPGLAKKDPPCVPPSLAKKGVTYNEWTSHDQEEYDAIWRARRDEWLSYEDDIDPDPELLLLQSDQIASLFGLDPAPEGQRYALIDGLPVLLDEDDYTSLLLLKEIAQVPDLTADVPIAPTAALTQDELINLYHLPPLGDDENYAVVNGQLVLLKDAEYEILQMIRIARAVL